MKWLHVPTAGETSFPLHLWSCLRVRLFIDFDFYIRYAYPVNIILKSGGKSSDLIAACVNIDVFLIQAELQRFFFLCFAKIYQILCSVCSEAVVELHFSNTSVQMDRVRL